MIKKKVISVLQEKNRGDRQLPPGVTLNLVTPLSFSDSNASSTYVRAGLCRPVKIYQKTLCQAA